MLATPETQNGLPDMKVSVRQVFGIDSNLEVPAYSQPEEHVPDLDPDYIFDRETTLAILAGFAYNRRVLIQGHGLSEVRDPLVTLLLFLAILLPFSLWVFARAVRRAKREGSLIQY